MTTVLVTDASSIVELLAEDGPRGTAVRERVRSEVLAAPELLDLEVVSVLRRLVRTGRLTGSRGDEAVADLAALPVVSEPHRPLLPRIWELRDTVTPYDAAYVALAERLDAVLLTTDARLSRASGVRCQVDVLTD